MQVNLNILGLRRENGRVGIRNHVLSCRWTTSRTRPARPWPTTSRGRWPCRTPTDGCSSARTSRLYFRTMIGTGANPNVAAVVVIGIEAGWTRKRRGRHREDGKARDWILHRRSRRHRNHRPGAREKPRNTCSGPPNCSREECVQRALGLDQVRRVRHHHRPASCPTVGNVIDKLIARASTASSARLPS